MVDVPRHPAPCIADPPALAPVIAAIVGFFLLVYRLATNIDETNANGDRDAWRDGEHHWTDHGPSH